MRVNDEKIRKYQAGGYMIYQPLPLSPVAPINVGSSEKETEQAAASVIDDKIIEKMIGEGLTNDVMHFSDSINSAYSQYEQMSDLERNSVYGKHLRTLMKGDLGQLNMIRRHKDMLTKAMANVETNQALSDLALTSNGFVIKDQTTGKISETTATEFAQKHSKNPNIKALTNAELIEEREYNPNLTFDQNTYAILKNGIGTNKVKEEVVSILSTLGSEKNETIGNSYVMHSSNLPPEVRQTITQLVGMGPEGYYKVNSKKSQETNVRLLDAAKNAMWMNLSDNSKNLLRGKAALSGVAASDIENAAKQYAISLLDVGYKNSVSEERTVDFDKTATDAASGEKGGTEALSGNLNYYTQLTSSAGDQQPVQIDTGDGNVTTAHGFSPGALISNGALVGKTSLRNIPELGGIIDNQSISIGGVKVPASKMDAIIYDGQEVTRVRLPAKQSGRGLVPDFNKAKDYNELKEAIKDVPTFAAKQLMAQQKGFTINAAGEISSGLEADFIVFDGMVNEDSLGGIGDTSMLEEVDGDDKSMYKNLFMYNSPSEADEKLAGTDKFGLLSDNWFNSNPVYRGRVYLALRLSQGVIAGRNADRDPMYISKSQGTPEALGAPKINNGVNPNFVFE